MKITEESFENNYRLKILDQDIRRSFTLGIAMDLSCSCGLQAKQTAPNNMRLLDLQCSQAFSNWIQGKLPNSDRTYHVKVKRLV